MSNTQTLRALRQEVQALLSLTGGGGPAGKSFTPTAGQTVFLLDETPVPLSVEININGSEPQFGIDFTVSGATVSLLPALGYEIDPSDRIRITYLKA